MEIKLGTIATIVSILAALVGGVYFLEDRFVSEKEIVMTVQQQQQVVDLQLLDLWREQTQILEDTKQEHPERVDLGTRLEHAKQNVQRIESRLFGK